MAITFPSQVKYNLSVAQGLKPRMMLAKAAGAAVAAIRCNYRHGTS